MKCRTQCPLIPHIDTTPRAGSADAYSPQIAGMCTLRRSRRLRRYGSGIYSPRIPPGGIHAFNQNVDIKYIINNV